MLKSIFKHFNIYYAKRNFMPVGIDWIWDSYRVLGDGSHVIFDIGANVGQTSLVLHQRFPRSTIHSFEPVKATFDTLVESTKDIPNISTHQLAVSDRCEAVRMMIGENSLTNCVLPAQVVDESSALQAESVQCITLDAFAQNYDISRIDLLKIDVEGFEPSVLRGAEGLFRRGAVECVFIEIGFSPSDTGHPYAPEIISQMYEYGFGFYGMYDLCCLLPPDYVSHGKVPTFGNALFLKSS